MHRLHHAEPYNKSIHWHHVTYYKTISINEALLVREVLEYIYKISMNRPFSTPRCCIFLRYYPYLKLFRILPLNNTYQVELPSFREIRSIINFEPLHSNYQMRNNHCSTAYVKFKFAIKIFNQGVPRFGTHCSCHIWSHGLTTCLLNVSPSLRYLISSTFCL